MADPQKPTASRLDKADGEELGIAQQQRNRRARFSTWGCMTFMSLFAAATITFLGTQVAGCWGGAYLFVTSAILLGIPTIALGATAIYLRLSELFRLLVALVMISFATGVILELLPNVVCSGSG